MPEKLSIGVDLGGTGIKIALLSREGQIRKLLKFSTPWKAHPQAVVELIVEQTGTLLQTVGPRHIQGMGIGAAGDVDQTRGVVRISPNLGWKNVPLRDLLRRRFKKLSLFVDNDANAAAWAAYIVEAKRRVKNLLCVTLGTGVGSGLILNGKLYRGGSGSAGELGHMTLYPEGSLCACGNQGCLERYVSARALVEHVRRAIETGHGKRILRLAQNDPARIDPIVLETAARRGDGLAQHLWDQAGERLGIVLASVINLLNPEWIVLAGGVSRAGDLILTPLRRTIQERAFEAPAQCVKIVLSRLDQDLGVVGAGLLAW